jgi:hypothetical protein
LEFQRLAYLNALGFGPTPALRMTLNKYVPQILDQKNGGIKKIEKGVWS